MHNITTSQSKYHFLPQHNDFNNPSVAKDQFCQWQWKERRSSRIHHDIAVLITRKSICESASCGVLGKQHFAITCLIGIVIGIATIKSICKPETSCAVVRDTGLSTAFTLAHELGHRYNPILVDNHNIIIAIAQACTMMMTSMLTVTPMVSS